MKKEALLYAKGKNAVVQCALCAHRCAIAPSQFGFCGVRYNDAGTLYTYAYGELIAVHVDPIEKKPLYHFLPGTNSFSIATIGCNFRCGFCQNWQISQQSFRDARASKGDKASSDNIVKAAVRARCKSISYTYTEPTIFFEYAYDIARLAHTRGLYNIFVTNGYMTAEALKTIQPYLHAANVDLKSFREETYKKVCQATLAPVLETIALMKQLNVWVEVTTLVVPHLNDSAQELKDIARFIVGIDKDIPWHISAFHPDYQYADTPSTAPETLRRAYECGKEAGLRYVYVGNVAGADNNTYCPSCGVVAIKRDYFYVEHMAIKNSSCPRCGAPIAGVFSLPREK